MNWHYIEQGQGRPLVLLHGIGMSHNAWNAVIPLLARHRRVIAFDLPGFGRSRMLPDGRVPNARNIVMDLKRMLDQLGVETPVDIAGNSLGGYLALEAARHGIARSVVALSPAGLWKGHVAPKHITMMFDVMRTSIKRFPRFSKAVLAVPPARALLMAVPVSSRAHRMPAREAMVAAHNFVHGPGFDATKDAVEPFMGGHDIGVPLTVAFGDRDWLLNKQCQHRDELPGHTRWLQPRGWGHVPMWDDPDGVARMILQGTE